MVCRLVDCWTMHKWNPADYERSSILPSLLPACTGSRITCQSWRVSIAASGLEGIIRNTWLPYTERLPAGLRPEFVSEVARRYIERYPLDEEGRARVAMMRLEVEAEKPALRPRP